MSPDDRFAGLLGASAERGGWVPGDVYTADTAGDEEPVEPRRVRLPVLVAVGIATIGILVLAFLLFRPAPRQSPGGDGPGQVAEAGQSPAATGDGAGTGAAGVEPAEGAAGTAEEKEGAASAKAANANGDVIVHITGAVNDPSVVTLKAGARVQDAVEAAGGLSAGADGEAVNLARVLTDGEQIHIPKEGEEPVGGVAGAGPDRTSQNGDGSDGTGSAGAGGAADGGTGSGSAGTAAASAGANGTAPGPAGKVDLNTADATTLETLPGVGPVTAEAIISHRSQQPFASVEDLLLVKGIGPKTFESLKDLVTVG
ncbi:competence protein ComEA [Brevibacterium siliguriense]|uniref:Competence protein ComEA n=1 Tax=Brevibacterium siliguriense TaxID=1136497 RepID=A0A1H1TMD6_9MICO|nr:competence protein ComEA [Brevibacterium siliguriense]